MATATMMTSAEFLARPDEFEQSGDRIKEELIGGGIVGRAEPSTWHDVTKNDIGDALAFHLRAHRELGLRSLIEIAFKVTENDTFRPDVSVVRTERLAEEGRILKGAPEIAVEVISPTDTVDKIREKIAAYLENGASSVWIFYRDGLVSVHTATGVRELKGETSRWKIRCCPAFPCPSPPSTSGHKSWSIASPGHCRRYSGVFPGSW